MKILFNFYLNKKNTTQISANLNVTERILLACAVTKYNDHDKRQERNIMITTKAVYNFSGSSK
jgi:hypothetical protein